MSISQHIPTHAATGSRRASRPLQSNFDLLAASQRSADGQPATCKARKPLAFTLIEMLVALGIFSMCGLAMMGLYMFGNRSLASLYNYASLDIKNRQAMDNLTYEIREARQVVDYTTNALVSSISLINGKGESITYLFDKSKRTFVRNNASTGERNVLLNNCSLLSFDLRQRNFTTNGFDNFPVATNNWQMTVKLLQLTWKTTQNLPNGVNSSENVQTAKIVIRKQQDTR